MGFDLDLLTCRHGGASRRAFDRAQAECYARFGSSAAVRKAASDDDADDSVIRLLLRCGDEWVGGIRLHSRRVDRPLPLERFFAGDPMLRAAIDARAPAGLAELAGLWSAPRWSGSGVGAVIVARAIECAVDRGIRHLGCFAHHHNKFARRLGFRRDRSLRSLPYPDERYRSSVLWCDATLARVRGESRWNSVNGLAASDSNPARSARTVSSME